MPVNLRRFQPPGRDLESISAQLSSVFTYVVSHSLAAVPSLTKWYAIDRDFLFKTESGNDELLKTDLLSPKT